MSPRTPHPTPAAGPPPPRPVPAAVPALPPLEVLAEVDAAASRAEGLSARGRELYIARDPFGRRVLVELRGSDGAVHRLSPREALVLMTGL
ncbi:MAG TPA: hypothetical protein VM266_05710 [Solirubrobacteraceae bacterium]|nr:hypothetical protein [Solirubrobacteraceae bacterium]